jgi:ankyrin repeat protein
MLIIAASDLLYTSIFKIVKMKKSLLVAVFALSALLAKGQQNTLLNQKFWQDKPNVAAIKAEVEKGNDPAQMNPSSFDPVVMAINADAPTESIKYLLSQPGNDIGKVTHDSRNYLHWAASKGNAEIMEYLLEKGAKTDNEDSHGSTPILFAAGGGQQNTKVYDLLIANGISLKASVNAAGANALLLAIANDPELVLTNYFVSKGLDLNSTDAAGNNAFSYATRSGNIELLKKLLQKGIKPNANAMLMAAQGSRRGANTLALYQYLESLNLKANVTNKNGENVLHSIVKRPKQDEIIKYFLSKGVDVNQVDEDGNSVLMNAAGSNRDLAAFELLMPGVKNVNISNKKGQTALTLAVRGNSPEVVAYLISKKADVKVLDKNGNSLAYYAVESYRPTAARAAGAPQGGAAPEGSDEFDAKMNLLRTAGLNINALQENANTLYHLAIAKNDVSILKRLAPMGIDINAKNKEGFTVLHKAAMLSKDDEVLKYLLSVGAKKDAVTSFDETAFDLASENESLTKNNVSLTFLK